MNSNISILQSDPRVLEISNADSEMSKLIQIIGNIGFELRQDYFTALTKSIIGQQLSPKAAETIYSRFEQLFQNDITPSSLKEIGIEQLRNVGVSKQKISYLMDLSNNILTKELNLDEISKMDNDQVVKSLTNIKGIGIWTAEMFLIFSLGKMNILPQNDLALQRAAKWLYSLDKEADVKSYLLQQSKAWGKNSTIACLYLWEAVNRDFIKKENIEFLIK
ncbi:DNA-3-methyladenine glycosylase 2 family protein [Bacillus thuringiensis]|uniref:DNA-3-methyladenine glycosylase family protein n=1 Tax=Bacillus pacificus TaxID=2026187 RepID=UPI0012987BC8|nr:DNA-3-methyladenine glycosylase [Bacillus pacificus]MCU5068333.1 DNA-3-methyladenine glycosylase [Bacillus pacificus]MRB23430.1 DNA-3-methyladenine glycosylase 2 family protein [Bacillus thuringiensis]